jgi:hypothetical protein
VEKVAPKCGLCNAVTAQSRQFAQSGHPANRFHFIREKNDCSDHIAQSQCDQIGRIFAYWVILYSGHFLKNYRSGQHFWASLFHGEHYASIFGKKMRWARIWAISAQTHLVTLLRATTLLKR